MDFLAAAADNRGGAVLHSDSRDCVAPFPLAPDRDRDSLFFVPDAFVPAAARIGLPLLQQDTLDCMSQERPVEAREAEAPRNRDAAAADEPVAAKKHIKDVVSILYTDLSGLRRRHFFFF